MQHPNKYPGRKSGRFVQLLLSLLLVLFPCLLHSQVPTIELRELEREVFRLTNNERIKYGLDSLNYAQELHELARAHSLNMLQQDFFSHIDPAGRSPGQRKILFFPKLFGSVGENIAHVRGGPIETPAETFVKMWMDSPGHRENILRESFGYLGVAVVEGEGAYYATQTFGDLTARLLDNVDDVYEFGSEQIFRFHFLGEFPKEKLSIFVQFPDSKVRFYVSENRFYSGMGLYEPEWQSDTFSIKIKLDKGHGSYKLMMGSYGMHHTEGLTFKVK